MNNKLKLIIATSLSAIILLVGSTYAWYVWQTNSDEETIIATGVGTAKVRYDSGADITGEEIYPVSDKSLGIKKGITISTDIESVNDVTFNLYLDVNTLGEGLKETSFKYEIYRSNTLVNSGNFSNDYLHNVEEPTNPRLVDCTINNTKHIVLLSNEHVTTTESTYVLYIWIDGNMNNPLTMSNENFDFTLHAEGTNAIIGEQASYPDITNIREGSLAYKIVNDYNNSEKEIVVNDGVKYLYDRENFLMSDIDGNIRYYGSNPNNYIYFNCEDYSNQSSSTCDIWRIIGVFEDKVKIMKNTQRGNLPFDIEKNVGADEYNSSDWNKSSLNKLLNGAYLNRQDTTYFTSSNGGSVTINYATNNIGIKETTKNLIADANWFLGNISADDTTLGAYKAERGPLTYNNDDSLNSTMSVTWYGKIALPYASDYGYAVDLSICNNQGTEGKSLNEYHYSTCSDNNWMYSIFGGSGNHRVWLLTPKEPYLISCLNWVLGSGTMFTSCYPTGASRIHPTLHLNAELTVNTNGDGSAENPYQLVANNVE